MLYNKLASLFDEGQTFWRNENVGISVTEVETELYDIVVTYSIFFGYNLPITEVVYIITGGEIVEEQIRAKKPITEEEVILKIRMI